jgi:hypothetical protein
VDEEDEPMNDPRAANTRWRWIGAVVVGLMAVSACAPKTAQRQTDIMERSGKVSVSAAVLRARVNDLVERFAGRIELTADPINAQTNDAALSRRALVLKVDAVPAAYTAAFRADPLAAAVDVWGFAFQFSQYMENGPGQDEFGSLQSLVRDCARDLLADADAMIKAIAIRPEYFDQARSRVEGWAKTHPVESTFVSRGSGAALVADLQSDARDVFDDVGTVSDVLENLSERLNTYAAQLPKQARWHAELLLTEMAGAHNLDGAFGDLHEIGTSARRASDLLGDLPALLRAERDILLGAEQAILAAERRAILAEVDSQRGQTLEFVTAERLAILAAARRERIALVAALRQERVDTVTEVDAMTKRAVDSVMTGFRDLVDYTLWRVAALTLGLMLAATTLGVIAYRLTPDRRRRAVTS